jgi:hypothetical protein
MIVELSTDILTALKFPFLLCVCKLTYIQMYFPHPTYKCIFPICAAICVKMTDMIYVLPCYLNILVPCQTMYAMRRGQISECDK